MLRWSPLPGGFSIPPAFPFDLSTASNQRWFRFNLKVTSSSVCLSWSRRSRDPIVTLQRGRVTYFIAPNSIADKQYSMTPSLSKPIGEGGESYRHVIFTSQKPVCATRIFKLSRERHPNPPSRDALSCLSGADGILEKGPRERTP